MVFLLIELFFEYIVCVYVINYIHLCAIKYLISISTLIGWGYLVVETLGQEDIN